MRALSLVASPLIAVLAAGPLAAGPLATGPLAGGPLAAESEPVPWTDIPLVRILGAVLGILLLWAAIRAMFGGKGRR